jgi:hypothetical protein
MIVKATMTYGTCDVVLNMKPGVDMPVGLFRRGWLFYWDVLRALPNLFAAAGRGVLWDDTHLDYIVCNGENVGDGEGLEAYKIKHGLKRK